MTSVRTYKKKRCPMAIKLIFSNVQILAPKLYNLVNEDNAYIFKFIE